MPRKALVLFLITLGAIAIFGALLFFNKQIPGKQEKSSDLSQLPKQSDSIPSWSKYSGGQVSFNHPSGYNVEEKEKGYFVISNENKDLGESDITVDTRKQGINSDYDEAVENAKKSLTDLKEKEISNGIKMFGLEKEGEAQGTPVLSVYLRFGVGALVIESSGEILNEAVFDQVVTSVTIN